MYILRNILAVLCMLFMSMMPILAQGNGEASATFGVTIPSFTRIEAITSPVLLANITDRTGNLHKNLSTRFRVMTNSAVEKKLYLKSHVVTDGGYEESMFMQGGQVYVAFANISKLPSSQALANCKMGSRPADSPGIVAYPLLSVTGAEHKFVDGSKYEVIVGNGTTNIDVNIGPFVQKSSFAANDKRGFYQTILSLTEADI